MLEAPDLIDESAKACVGLVRRVGSGSNNPSRSQPRLVGNSNITSRPWATIFDRPSGESTPLGKRHAIPPQQVHFHIPAARGSWPSGARPGPALSVAPLSLPELISHATILRHVLHMLRMDRSPPVAMYHEYGSLVFGSRIQCAPEMRRTR